MGLGFILKEVLKLVLEVSIFKNSEKKSKISPD